MNADIEGSHLGWCSWFTSNLREGSRRPKRKESTQGAITRKPLNRSFYSQLRRCMTLLPFICNQLKLIRYARQLRHSNTVSQKTSSRGHAAERIAKEWVISKESSRSNIERAPTIAVSSGRFPIHSVPRQVFDGDLDVSTDHESKKVPLSPASRLAQAKAAKETFRGALMTMCYWRSVKFCLTGCQECK